MVGLQRRADAGTAGGYEMVRHMREVVRDLDTSRPSPPR